MEHAEFRKYLKLLEELTKTIRKLNGLAQRKIRAVHENNVQEVDECIREEQVLSLSLRGIEQRREKALKALGLEGVRLSGLPLHAPEELRSEASRTAEELRGEYQIYQTASNAARTALERVLREVDLMLAEEQRAQAQAAPQTEPPESGHGADFKA